VASFFFLSTRAAPVSIFFFFSFAAVLARPGPGSGKTGRVAGRQRTAGIYNTTSAAPFSFRPGPQGRGAGERHGGRRPPTPGGGPPALRESGGRARLLVFEEPCSTRRRPLTATDGLTTAPPPTSGAKETAARPPPLPQFQTPLEQAPATGDRCAPAKVRPIGPTFEREAGREPSPKPRPSPKKTTPRRCGGALT